MNSNLPKKISIFDKIKLKIMSIFNKKKENYKNIKLENENINSVENDMNKQNINQNKDVSKEEIDNIIQYMSDGHNIVNTYKNCYETGKLNAFIAMIEENFEVSYDSGEKSTIKEEISKVNFYDNYDEYLQLRDIKNENEIIQFEKIKEKAQLDIIKDRYGYDLQKKLEIYKNYRNYKRL